MFDPKNPLVQFNQKLHTSKIYNTAQFVISAAAVFSGSAYKTMNPMNKTCFVAGTLILTASGLTAIENIKAGDRVISTNPETFETTEKTVLETYVREVGKLLHININKEEVITTVDHPFYVRNYGFKNAEDLKVGDRIVDLKNDSLLIEDISFELVKETEKVYNFQVKDFHTYYVGKNNMLVHNADGKYKYPYTEEQIQLQKEGKIISKNNKISMEKAKDYVKRCRKAGIPEDVVRIDKGHYSRTNSSQLMEGISGQPHLHVPCGKNSHIRIE